MRAAGWHEKPFVISKVVVSEAYEKVKANKGAAGVDGRSLAAFETDLRATCSRFGSGCRRGGISRPSQRSEHTEAARRYACWVPTGADRIAQSVVALTREPRTESIFHDDSFGYRPGRSALQAVRRCRQRCFRRDWALDLHVAQFFDSVPHDLMVKRSRPTPTSRGCCCM